MKITHIIALLLSTLRAFSSYSLEDMSLEEKVGQLLVVHFRGEEANEDAKILIEQIHVGGIVYYNWANGLHCPEQVVSLSRSLQTLAKETRLAIPLLLAVDQEGGLVARLTKGFTVFPGNKSLGLTANPALAEEAAFAMGQELRSVGINFNLAPVVDINNNPRNPIIGIRSFGDSPEEVTLFARRALNGYKRANILTTLKHFPGHGDVEVDSHKALPILHKSKKQLQAMELIPFSALAKQADAVMTAHILVPSLDKTYSATLSKPILDLLRKEIGFEGVIISDSLVMKGLLQNCPSIEEAAILAVQAGCDLLLLGGRHLGQIDNELTVADVKEIHETLVRASQEGRIHKSRLDDAVKRILSVKNRLSFPEEEIENKKEREILARRIASLAVKCTVNQPLSFQRSHFALFAPESVREAIEQTSLVTIGEKTELLFFTNPSQEEIKRAHEMAKEAEAIIFCSYNAWNHKEQRDFLHSLQLLKKPIILISLRDPLDEECFPEIDLSIKTHSPTVPSIQAAADELRRILQIKS